MIAYRMRVPGLILLLVAVLAIGPIAGCGGGGGGGPKPSGTATVTGTILHDGTLDPVALCTAAIGTRTSARTGTTGVFTITQTPAGAQTLTVAQYYYESFSTTVSVQKPTTDVGTVYLAPRMTSGQGAVTGVVVSGPTSSPLGGVGISVGGQSGKSRSDGTGIFRVYKIPVSGTSQTYTLYAVDASNGWTASKPITVRAGTALTNVGTITLKFGPPPPPDF